MKTINKQEFVVLDVETTGLSPRTGDRIIEFAALKAKGDRVLKRFHTLIDPKREISYGAFCVNGISQDMLDGAPPIEEVLDDILEFIGDSIIVGHNIKFDMNFINNELVINDYPPLDQHVCIDTIKMSRALLPGLIRYSLDSVGNKLNIKNDQAHRAMSDVNVTFGVFKELLNLARIRGVKDLGTILNLFSTNKRKSIAASEAIKNIDRAIAKKGLLELLYMSTTSGATNRRVSPKTVMGSGKKAVLIGYCHLRGEERYFRMDRIIHCLPIINENV